MKLTEMMIEKYDSSQLMLLAYIKSYCVNDRYLLTLPNLCYYIYGDQNKNKRKIKTILDSLDIFSSVDGGIYKIKPKTFAIKGIYANFSMSDLDVLVSNGQEKIFKTFLTLVYLRRKEWNYKAMNYSRKFISNRLGIHPVTVSKHIGKLEELKLIYCVKPSWNNSQTNIYSLYSDREVAKKISHNLN